MSRFYVLLTAALIAWSCFIRAQIPAGERGTSVLALPQLHDSLRLRYRYIPDGSMVLIISEEANAWLCRSYEFHISIGPARAPLRFAVWLDRCDSLFVSCAAADRPDNGSRLVFCRAGAGFRFCTAEDFQVFPSGIERICRIPFHIRGNAARSVVSPTAGAGSCRYILPQDLRDSVPSGLTIVPLR